jgi:TrpR-related protein YerC/YecD
MLARYYDDTAEGGHAQAMEDWRSSDVEQLIDALLRLDTPDEAAHFLRDLCTLREIHDLAQRWAVVRRLDQGEHYAAISRDTGASTATITRIATWLNHGEGGYRTALEKLSAAREAGVPYPTGRER